MCFMSFELTDVLIVAEVDIQTDATGFSEIKLK